MHHAYEKDQAGCIRIGVKSESELMTITIEDDGRGIPADELIHIFDPFFTTHRGEGRSGLGLHIAYNMATGKLGGKIMAESVIGEGTKVELKIPDLRSI